MPRPVKVPALVACPRCSLPVQAGKDPNGLAWHDCEHVLRFTEDVSEESIRKMLLRRIRDATASASPKELIGLLNALRDAGPERQPEEDPDEEGDGLASWFRGGSARPH